jgi:sulfoxide reductase heme-binding subunit YedZ
VPEALEGVPWSWTLIRATGITAWCALTAVVAWGLAAAALRLRGAPPARAVWLHRWLTTLALGLLFAHMALLLVDSFQPFSVVEILVPLAAPWRPFAVALGTVAFWLIVPAWLLGRLRGRRRYRWFKRAHGLAYAAWPLATTHYVLAGTDALTPWSLGILIGGTAAVVGGLLARARCGPRRHHAEGRQGGGK